MLSELYQCEFDTQIVPEYSVVLQFQSSRLWVSPGCPVAALSLLWSPTPEAAYFVPDSSLG